MSEDATGVVAVEYNTGGIEFLYQVDSENGDMAITVGQDLFLYSLTNLANGAEGYLEDQINRHQRVIDLFASQNKEDEERILHGQNMHELARERKENGSSLPDAYIRAWWRYAKRKTTPRNGLKMDILKLQGQKEGFTLLHQMHLQGANLLNTCQQETYRDDLSLSNQEWEAVGKLELLAKDLGGAYLQRARIGKRGRDLMWANLHLLYPDEEDPDPSFGAI